MNSMKINILDYDHLIELNKLPEVTSPRLFSNKDMYDPDGILSNELFGIDKTDRKRRYAFIDLKSYYIHPHIYHAVMKKIFKAAVFIVSGNKRYIIEDGKLIQDDDGWTGIDNLYKHWDEIDFNKLDSSDINSVSLLRNLPKEKIFINKLIIIPPFYRDVLLATNTSTSDNVNELNGMYTSIISKVDLLNKSGLFKSRMYVTQASIQDALVEIYMYFRSRMSGKYGVIKRYLMGKNVSYGTRSVISAFSYNNETIYENMIDSEHCALPLSQCCSTFKPFIVAWVKDFFIREIINDSSLVVFYDNKSKKEIITSIKDPEIQFSDKNINNMILDYVKNPDNRFKIITVQAYDPLDNSQTISVDLYMKGRNILANNQSDLKRPMTITDVLYLASVECCEKRHVMISRYPVGTDKGLFFNKVRVQSTIKHMNVIFNGINYPFYPFIDLNTPHHLVGIMFNDTLTFTNSLLDGLGGDFVG